MRKGLVVDAQLELVSVLDDREGVPCNVEVVVKRTLVPERTVSQIAKATYELFS